MPTLARPAARRAAVPRPTDRSGRRVDFVALTAARIGATPAELAAARAAGRATRARLDRLAGRVAAEPAPVPGMLPFPPFEAPAVASAPASARPTDAAAVRRYTRTAA